MTVGKVRIADASKSRVRLVSWFASCAGEGFTGSRLTACRRVCEVDQSRPRLGAIKLLRIRLPHGPFLRPVSHPVSRQWAAAPGLDPLADFLRVVNSPRARGG